MAKEWKISKIDFIDDPIKINLEQLGLSLFVSQLFVFSWYSGYFFSYSQQRSMTYNEKDKEIIIIHHVFGIGYTELPKYKKFVEVDTNTAKAKIVDEIDRKMDLMYFPIEKTDDPFHKKIFDKIVETEKD